jgi:hypothetical protein
MNLSHKASAAGVSFPLTVETVWVGRNCLSYWNPAILPAGAQIFKGTMFQDSKIDVLGQTYRSPSYAMAAVRNVVEGKAQNASPRPTGGWPYWHFQDASGQPPPHR